MTYIVSFPATRFMSPIQFVVSDKPFETWREEALWHYNHARAHDGLPPVEDLPVGTRHVPLILPETPTYA